MKKLNELVEQSKEISSKNWFINSDEEVTAIDNDAGPDDSEDVFIGCAANIQLAKYIAAANPENIIAIAEAFRALEQRAEENQEVIEEYNAAMCASNEAGYSGVTAAQTIRHLMERAEEAEAKLADLEKQEPVAYVHPAYLQAGALGFDASVGRLAPAQIPLFTRPAPAADLAELVPSKLEEKDGDYQNLRDEKRGYNTCIDAILRNIEEAK